MDSVSTLQMLWLPVLVVVGVVAWVSIVIRQTLLRKHAARQATAVFIKRPQDTRTDSDET